MTLIWRPFENTAHMVDTKLCSIEFVFQSVVSYNRGRLGCQRFSHTGKPCMGEQLQWQIPVVECYFYCPNTRYQPHIWWGWEDQPFYQYRGKLIFSTCHTKLKLRFGWMIHNWQISRLMPFTLSVTYALWQYLWSVVPVLWWQKLKLPLHLISWSITF